MAKDNMEQHTKPTPHIPPPPLGGKGGVCGLWSESVEGRDLILPARIATESALDCVPRIVIRDFAPLQLSVDRFLDCTSLDLSRGGSTGASVQLLYDALRNRDLSDRGFGRCGFRWLAFFDVGRLMQQVYDF